MQILKCSRLIQNSLDFDSAGRSDCRTALRRVENKGFSGVLMKYLATLSGGAVGKIKPDLEKKGVLSKTPLDDLPRALSSCGRLTW